MIELSPTVIGDVDEVDAVIETEFCVLRGSDALDGERDLVLRLDALDGLPIERCLEFAARGAPAPAGDMALGDVALAPAVMGGVDGETEHAVLVGDGAGHMVVDPGRIAAHIELEHAQRVGRRLGDPFEAGIADRAQHMGAAEFAGRLDHGCCALGVKTFQRADRAQHDRQPQLAAENFSRDVDLADVPQYARPERDRVQRHAISSQRGLGLDAADDVVPGVLVEILSRLGDDLVQVEEFITLRCSLQEPGFVEFLSGHCGDTHCWLRGSTTNFSP